MTAQPIRSCRVCGCTDQRACPGGCAWAGPDLCTACAPVAGTLSPRPPLTSVNLTTRPGHGLVGRKAGTDSGGDIHPPSPVGLRSGNVDVPSPASTPGDGAPAWHEITYKHPRWGPRSHRWVLFKDARRAAVRVRKRHPGVPVEIWAVYRDHDGHQLGSVHVETIGGPT